MHSGERPRQAQRAPTSGLPLHGVRHPALPFAQRQDVEFALVFTDYSTGEKQALAFSGNLNFTAIRNRPASIKARRGGGPGGMKGAAPFAAVGRGRGCQEGGAMCEV